MDVWGDITSLKLETVKDLIHLAWTCNKHDAKGCSLDIDIDPDEEVLLNVEFRFKLVDKEK